MRMHVMATAKPPICDFCSSPYVIVSYLATPFIDSSIPGVAVEMSGGWASCAECARLIDTENWDALLFRSASTFLLANDLPESYRPQITACIDHLHQLFVAHRIGAN